MRVACLILSAMMSAMGGGGGGGDFNADENTKIQIQIEDAFKQPNLST